jgi:hypothetical protein
MRVLITDLFTGECELTGKKDAECVRVKLDDAAPEAVVATSELFRLLRFHVKQVQKKQAESSTKGTHS